MFSFEKWNFRSSVKCFPINSIESETKHNIREQSWHSHITRSIRLCVKYTHYNWCERRKFSWASSISSPQVFLIVNTVVSKAIQSINSTFGWNSECNHLIFQFDDNATAYNKWFHLMELPQETHTHTLSSFVTGDARKNEIERRYSNDTQTDTDITR